MKVDLLRPTTLDEYIGQDDIKEPLLVAITSAKERGEPLPHVLLSGPPGLGKTTLAMIIAHEMQWNLLDLIGSTAGNPRGLSQRLLAMNPKTMLFIDEIHALRKPVQEVLYPVLEDNRLLYRRGSASAEFPLPPLTVLGATTDLGTLAQPFIDRFQLQFDLKFYEPDELVELAQQSAIKLGLQPWTSALEVIADRSRGTPRFVNRYLKWIRDYKFFDNFDGDINRDYAEHIMWKKLGVDKLGLRPLDRNYLRVLAEASGPVGIESIAARLRQAEVTLQRTVEPYLLGTGLVERTGSGRRITDKGREHLGDPQKGRVTA